MRLSISVCLYRSASLPIVFAAVLLSIPLTAQASTITVCASGCAFTDFQLALNAAQPGDTILLRAGETFIGNFNLPVKAGSGAPILIRSDAPDSALPGPNVRLVPQGRPGANTSLSALARLRGKGGLWKSTPVVQAMDGAHGYVLQFLDIDGFAQEGWETLVQLGSNAPEQNTLASVPYSIVLDRVFVHGHPVKAQKRCVSLDGRDLALLNSYVADCASWSYDAQAVAGFNGPGPFRIINNYLEASGENVMFGGADPRITGLVPTGLEIRRNHFFKPAAWRNAILAAPSSAPSATVSAGAGSLAAGTHYFTVVAILQSGGELAASAQSPERAVSVAYSGSAVTLSWPAVAGADWYRIYRGTAAGGENRFLETSGAVTSFTYRGSGETAATPRAQGTRWNVKNLLELKNAKNVLIEGNVFEQVWAASQTGYALVLTPRNQDGTAPWVVVSDITIVNNIIRHTAGAFSILGEDDINDTQPTGRITIRNNLVHDVSRTWGGSSHFMVMSRGPYDITVDHNTIFHEGSVILADDGVSSGFQFTNNTAPHNSYGIFGSGAGMGTAGLATYFPNAVVKRNALGGAPAWLYPTDNLYPDMATFTAQFADPSSLDFSLVSGSIFRNAGTDGKNLGADLAALAAAVEGVATTGGVVGGGGDGGGGGTGGTGSLPYGGAARAVPGVIQAEDFDEGGNGVGYGDTTAGNAGGVYRSADVDLAAATDTGGGYCVGWIKPGEWLKYSVNVAAAGSYRVEFRVASLGGGGTFHLEVNGVDKTGPLTMPNTGGHQAWATVSKADVPLSAGPQVWALVMDSAGAGGGFGNINHITIVAPVASGSTPFNGAATALPGTLQAENFDHGGEGVAYHDATAGNSGGEYRNPTNVDIASAQDTGGGYTLGWVGAGEWLNYTVSVAAAGTYDIEVRVACSGTGGTFHLEVNGVNKTGSLAVPNTGGWQTWATVRKTGVSLAAGVQVWRLVMDSNGASSVGNFNYIRVAPASGGGTGSTPFGGTPMALPGTVQAEDYDSGGEGVAYHDLSQGNEGAQYRTTNVDIAVAADVGGGYTLGWVGASEWLNYTVAVGSAGTYDIEVRVASAGSGGAFHIEVDGVDVTGVMNVPNTGGWQSWTTLRRNAVTLAAGTQVWRIVMDGNGATGAVGNFNYFRVIAR